MPLSFLFLLSMLSHDGIIDLQNWPQPVLLGGKPYFFENRLYIVDNYEDKIKAYRHEDHFSQVDFLWATPGAGQGPGEIPRGSRINNLTVDPETRHLWVSHTRGFVIFDQEGKMQREIRSSFNASRIVPSREGIFTTIFNQEFGTELHLISDHQLEKVIRLRHDG